MRALRQGAGNLAAFLTLFIFVALTACGMYQEPITPAQHTANLRLSVQWAQLNCKAYTALGNLPRDPLLDAKCPALVTTEAP